MNVQSFIFEYILRKHFGCCKYKHLFTGLYVHFYIELKLY